MHNNIIYLLSIKVDMHNYAMGSPIPAHHPTQWHL